MIERGKQMSDKQEWEKGLTEKEKEFEDNLRKLVMLLDDPYPGLLTWNAMRLKLAKEIYEFLKAVID